MPIEYLTLREGITLSLAKTYLENIKIKQTGKFQFMFNNNLNLAKKVKRKIFRQSRSFITMLILYVDLRGLQVLDQFLQNYLNSKQKEAHAQAKVLVIVK